MSSETRRLVNDSSPAQLSRALVSLINTDSDRPCDVCMEYLTDEYGLALSVIQAPYVLRQYITGGYVAAYQFELIYRTLPVTDAERLEADETLDELVTWLLQNIDSLDLADISIKKAERQSLAALTARYQNGAEDHTSALSIEYEVI